MVPAAGAVDGKTGLVWLAAPTGRQSWVTGHSVVELGG